MNAGQIRYLKIALDKLRAALLFYKSQEHEDVQKCIKEVIYTLKIVLEEDNDDKED